MPENLIVRGTSSEIERPDSGDRASSRGRKNVVFDTGTSHVLTHNRILAFRSEPCLKRTRQGYVWRDGGGDTSEYE